MSGPRPYDPRVTLARPDLADLDLQGLVAAERYEAPTLRQVAVPTAALRKAAHPMAEQWDQLLFGELFNVLEVKDGFAWGQAARDGYVGFVAEDDLAARGAPATHQVAVPRTYAFAEPDIKSRPVGLYSQNALTAIEAAEGRFARGEGTGWFVAAHLRPVGVALADPVAVAEGYLGAPYQWGGRESLGLDCSGLVQQALAACGKAVPRDTDLQLAFFTPVAEAERRRGDLVFWKGHVALLLDADTILHANAHHMAVAIEPLAEAVARIEAAGGGGVTGWRRP
ncbi:cell wall-associated NlpC family hydrolase [Caulobacter rhizosphaerae]|jgi:cell wall-associated NlpC family hydrolase|uniref:Cell wall-associated NlpC family hydrolase n=1 Tax=Caulobacter rhizosphaerae TaxID=2010972 RepID=A0ABU1MWH1_9CAUL|nr:NlpC/P60 family protein [Caulobacter rhizosphaerae]MDR6530538.1 cell wall-associated NlpC family hydrolase [Caulobacter rhizosphaerae]